MVDPRGADLDLHRDFQQEFCDSLFTMKEEAPPNVHALLSRHGITTSNKIKVEEFCIKPKNSLFVLGTLGDNSGLELTQQPIRDDETSSLISGNALSFSVDGLPLGRKLSAVIGDGRVLSALSLNGGLQHDPAYDPIYEEAAAAAKTRVIRLSPDPGPTKAADMTQQQKIAAALTKAGISNPAAWVAAGVASPALGVTTSSPSNGKSDPPDGFDTHPAVVLMKGENNPTFLISWRSQREIARSLAWKCALMIWGGPALALLSLYGLITFMHWL